MGVYGNYSIYNQLLVVYGGTATIHTYGLCQIEKTGTFGSIINTFIPIDFYSFYKLFVLNCNYGFSSLTLEVKVKNNK